MTARPKTVDPAPATRVRGPQRKAARVQLVVVENVGIMYAYVDAPELADRMAKILEGVVVELPTTADYRTR